jgi:AraC family transcriptional regulator
VLHFFPASPEHTWLGYHRDFRPDHRHVVSHVHRCIKVVLHVDAMVDWSTAGRVSHYDTAVGGVGIWPADERDHTFVIRPRDRARSFILLIPPDSILAAAAAEGIRSDLAGRPRYVLCDAGLRQSVLGVIDHVTGRRGTAPPHDEPFHLLALRVAEVITGRRSEWHRDTAAFTGPVLDQIVSLVDESLAAPPGLAHLAALTGLSPGHFARKFTSSTGLSLGRFVNKRRVRRALDRLRDRTVPLSHLAVELGYDSQSHFTRVFRGLTGMTPARFRREILG